MVESLVGRDAASGVVLEEVVEEVEAALAEVGGGGGAEAADDVGGGPERVDGPVLLVLGEVAHGGPHGEVGRAHDLEDGHELLLRVGAGEERAPRGHLGEDAARGPHVDRRRVLGRAHEHVGRAVPERDDLVRERAHRDPKRAREPKVRELQVAALVDQQVLRLQVAVQHAVVVAERNSLQQVPHQRVDRRRVQPAPAKVHKLLQVLVQKLKHQRQLPLRVDHVVQPHNVRVHQLLQQRDLPDRRARHPLVNAVQPDPLQRHNLPRLPVLRLVHHPVRPLTHLLQLRVLVHLARCPPVSPCDVVWGRCGFFNTRTINQSVTQCFCLFESGGSGGKERGKKSATRKKKREKKR